MSEWCSLQEKSSRRTKTRIPTYSGASEVVPARPILITGGGCNFGVVTEFTYQAYPHSHPVYSGLLVFTPAHLEVLVEAFNTWISTGGKDPKTWCSIAVASPPPAFVPMIIVLIFYDGNEEEGIANFKPFYDIGPFVDMTRPRPYVEQVNR
jgi:hypothetical protein